MARIFISYRQKKAAHIVRSIVDALSLRFGNAHFFFDRGIEGGKKWSAEIEAELQRCNVFISVMHKSWDRDPRLHRPDDWVRHETSTVLKRNEIARSRGEAEPVLIIPIHLHDVKDRAPTPTLIPPELQEVCSIQGIKCPSETTLFSFAFEQVLQLIEKQAGELYTGNLSIGCFSGWPAPYSFSPIDYRFRSVKSSTDLEPFVRLSDLESDIANANPGLSGNSRLRLYENWCAWTARKEGFPWDDPSNSVPTFLMLEKAIGGTWVPISVSIILPLSQQGHVFLTRPHRGVKTNATGLQRDHLSVSRPYAFLLDTWIIAKISPPGAPPVRVRHHGWGRLLVLRHLAEMWSPDVNSFVSNRRAPNDEWRWFLVEPDNKKLESILLNNFGFTSRPRANSEPILELAYPQLSGGMSRARFAMLLETMDRSREIPIQ